MKTENINYLRTHIHHWHTLRDAGYIQNVSGETAAELPRIAQDEFDARYLLALHHPQNVCELISYVYTQFEHFEAEAPLENALTETPVSGAVVAPVAGDNKIVSLAMCKPTRCKCGNAKQVALIMKPVSAGVLGGGVAGSKRHGARPPPAKVFNFHQPAFICLQKKTG